MLNRLLITGANGNLGREMRTRLTHLAKTIRLSDRGDLGEAQAHEELMPCDLADKEAVQKLVEGCDGILHLGGQSVEAPWEVIRSANLDGMFNLYEGARKSSVTPRIIFASSNHAIGYHKQTERLDAKSVTRPDGLYGVSKVFGEAIASMYHDKFGDRDGQRAHRLLLCGAQEPPDAVHMDEPRGFRAPDRAGLHRAPSGLPDHLRRLGQCSVVVGQPRSRLSGLEPAGQLRAVPRQDRRRDGPAAG